MFGLTRTQGRLPVHEPVALCGANRPHRGLVEPLSKAHEHEEAEHGVPESFHDHDPAGRRLLVGAAGLPQQLVREHAAHPGARGREEADARRVQRLGDEVAPQEAPRGTIAGARDGVVALTEEGTRDRRAVGQRGASLHQGCVGHAPVGHVYGEAGSHAQRHDGAVPREEAHEEGLKVGRGVPQPQQAAEHRQGEGSRRDAAAILGFTRATL
ncbi:hypothetical protein ACQ4PT_028804 [Festuca glaucescens]